MLKDTISRLQGAGDIADQMTSRNDHEILKRFDRARAEIRAQYGEPQTSEEDDHETELAFQRVPGARRALNSWGDKVEKYRLAGSDN